MVSSYEKQFAGLSVEKAVVISKSGEVLVEKIGTATRVSFTSSETEKMKDAIVLHNHPGVGSFSEADIAVAATHQVAEMRVVDKKYRYTMKPPKGGWSKTLWKESLEPVMLDAETRVVGNMTDALLRGKITEDQYRVHFQHEVWHQTAKQTGIIYHRRRRKP